MAIKSKFIILTDTVSEIQKKLNQWNSTGYSVSVLKALFDNGKLIVIVKRSKVSDA